MSSSTIPVLFEMYRGNDIAFNVLVKDKNTGDPLDITGWSFKTTMKRGPTDDVDDSAAPVVVDSGELSGTDAEAGIYPLHIPSSQTRNLGPGLYYIDVQQEFGGMVSTAIYGRVRVTANITRRAA